jgi:hypothetical protein
VQYAAIELNIDASVWEVEDGINMVRFQRVAKKTLREALVHKNKSVYCIRWTDLYLGAPLKEGEGADQGSAKWQDQGCEDGEPAALAPKLVGRA